MSQGDRIAVFVVLLCLAWIGAFFYWCAYEIKWEHRFPWATVKLFVGITIPVLFLIWLFI
jgi:ABC-type phosphate transport system auxiliary subunit